MRLTQSNSRRGVNSSDRPPARAQTGLHGERLAEEFLRKRGFKTLLRRFNCAAGEIDLVMRERDTIVFVEVKTQSDDRLVDPRERLTPSKRARLTRAARWLVSRRRWQDRPLRFDLVTILRPQAGEPQINHTAGAFMPKVW